MVHSGCGFTTSDDKFLPQKLTFVWFSTFSLNFWTMKVWSYTVQIIFKGTEHSLNRPACVSTFTMNNCSCYAFTRCTTSSNYIQLFQVSLHTSYFYIHTQQYGNERKGLPSIITRKFNHILVGSPSDWWRIWSLFASSLWFWKTPFLQNQ